MKVINKKSEREREHIESEKKSPAAIKNKQMEKARKQEEEKKARIVRVVLDWRVSGQLASITKAIWEHQTKENRVNFLKHSIKNRTQLKELYVEPFEYNAHGNTETIEVEYDKDTIDMLNSEASKEGLGFNEYVTSIVYTTAFNINQEREKARAISEVEAKERASYIIGGSHISQELKRKLDSKYGKPESVLAMGVPADAYTNMLIDLAKEYFGMDK